MNFETAKNLGGIGALLIFIGFLIPSVSFLGNIISIVGLVLVLISLYGLAAHYKEREIFNNALLGVITGIVGAVIVAIIAIVLLLPTVINLLQAMYPGWNGTDWAALSGMTANTNISPDEILPIISSGIVGGIAAWLLMWVIAIIATFFIRKSLKTLSLKSGTGLFGTTGLIMLVGGALTVIGIGFLLIWISVLLLAIAFFMLKREVVETAPTPPPPE